jgi:hypothetical protein
MVNSVVAFDPAALRAGARELYKFIPIGQLASGDRFRL